MTGCSTYQNTSLVTIPANRQGVVHGGQQPVSGATIQLYAVGTTADGSAATPLLTPSVVTDANGGFSITGLYHCPSVSTLVYLVASGGNPGLAVSTNNTALALMTALGTCGNLSASTFIQVNEVTSVAAVYALAPYMTSLSSIGSAPGDAAALSNAFALAAELANTTTGITPGTGVPVGVTVPVAQINTISNIIASCINSAGGTQGDSTVCGTLFSLATLPGHTVSNTLAALLSLGNNPTLNTQALYNLVTPTAPFQPSQPVVPPDLAVRLIVSSGLTVSPSVVNFPATRLHATSAPQTLTFTNNTATAVGVDVSALDSLFSGINSLDFRSFSNSQQTCSVPIQPGGTCTVQISFAPTDLGARTAYLNVTNSSANSVLSVQVNGTGLEAGAGPVSLTGSGFNFTAANTPQTATLTNNGTTTLLIDGISISNDPTSGQPAFSQTNTCGASLAPQGTCMISVAALTTAQAYSSGTLTVADDAAAGAQTLALTYSNGFTGSVLWDFKSVSIGAQDATYNYSFNPPGAPTTTTLTLTGPNASDFSFSSSSSVQSTVCNRSRLSPTCGPVVYFNPSALGLRTVTISAAGVPFAGYVGTGIPAGLNFLPSVSSINFNTTVGKVNVGQTSGGVPVSVVNNGTVVLTLNAPVLSGPAASEFNVSSQCTSLALGASCNLTVTATPTQAGIRTATLTLTDSTNAAQQTIALKVFADTPAPVVNPSTISFSLTPLGTVSAPQSFTIAADGNHPVTLVLGIAQYSPFFLSGGTSCASTPCQLSVAFAPTAANTAAAAGNNSYGNLYVIDMATGESTAVSLSGVYQ